MAYTLKDKIFSFFGINAKVSDTYKDVSGKGIGERYQEIVGEDYDEEMQPLVDDFHDNIGVPSSCFPELIEFLEHMVGDPIIILGTEAHRRKMIEFNNSITMIKGTLLSHQVLFGIIGITTVTITPVDRVSGFDSSEDFDSPVRKFDAGGICCQHYTLELNGVTSPSDELTEIITRIAFFLKPINAELDSITYNFVNVFDATFDETFG